ncbi:MAG: MBOAT family protein [Lachnospiraceae bacterium]|nr:MBOAT family protein [Lachnospiraceae bacterium]
MGITSFYFLCFFAFILIVYYVIPKKLQWGLLLMCSVAYYLLSGNGMLILYPVVSVTACYAGIRMMSVTFAENVKKRKGILILTIIVNVGILVVLKYVNFGIYTIDGIAKMFGSSEELIKSVDFLIPLGVSFYTFSLLGYVVDVYYGLAKPQKNYLKLMLYGMYFPVIISGPILKYREHGEQFFEPHAFDYVRVTRGLQRMVWGFFKKLVIAERLGMLVDTVYGGYMDYPGAYIWIATVCYAFQLYTDFSGCMDIVLGMSESLGIILPENFQTPFFAGSIAEYWRRWHITLGVWMKEYVFYPVMRTKFYTNLNQSWREKFGKKKGKQYATFAAMFILWLTVGIWHGGDWKFVIGSGLLHWFYIVMEELLTPPCARFMEKFHINPKGRAVGIVRIVRTFFLVCIGDLFFRAASVGDAFAMLRKAVSVWNPSVLINGSLFELGLERIEAVIAAAALLLLYLVSLLQQKGSVREQVARIPLPIRWMIWYALLFGVILFGCYGPGYSASEFIYQGF